MTEPIKVAIVGAGRIARQHIACLKTIPGVEVAGVCDLSPVRAEYMAEALGAGRAFSDATTMLAEIRPRVVHVTSPPASHFSLASHALRAGAHVIVEKPICLALTDFVALRKLATEQDRFLVEDHNYLWNPEVRRALEWVADGTLGRIVGIEICFAVPLPTSMHSAPSEMPGGPIFDFLPHMAYLVNAFVGNCLQVKTSWEIAREGTNEYEEFRAIAVCRDGPATLAFSARSRPNEFQVTVHGSHARVRINLLEPYLSIDRVRPGRPAVAIAMNGVAQAGAHFRAVCAGLWGRIAGNPGPYSGMWELLRRTYEALRRGEPQPVPLDDIEATQRLIAALVPGDGGSTGP